MTSSAIAESRQAAFRAQLSVDKTSPIPLYHQLAEQLTKGIRDGILQPGDQFENEVSLAQYLDLSRPTVRRSIAVLVDRGLVVRRRGVGTTVAHETVHRRAEFASLHDDLAASGLVPTTRVLKLAFGQHEPRAAHALNLAPATPLVALERLRMANGVPMALLRNWLALPLRDLSVADLEAGGLYELLRQRAVWPSVAQQTIGSRSATSEEHRLLQTGRGEPVLTVSQLAFDDEGAPIDFGEHSYRASLHRFEVTRRSAPTDGTAPSDPAARRSHQFASLSQSA